MLLHHQLVGADVKGARVVRVGVPRRRDRELQAAALDPAHGPRVGEAVAPREGDVGQAVGPLQVLGAADRVRVAGGRGAGGAGDGGEVVDAEDAVRDAVCGEAGDGDRVGLARGDGRAGDGGGGRGCQEGGEESGGLHGDGFGVDGGVIINF